MARVVIKCPKTGEDVDTGIAMDGRSWESSQMSNNSVACAQCGGVHRWDKKDAALRD